MERARLVIIFFIRGRPVKLMPAAAQRSVVVLDTQFSRRSLLFSINGDNNGRVMPWKRGARLCFLPVRCARQQILIVAGKNGQGDGNDGQYAVEELLWQIGEQGTRGVHKKLGPGGFVGAAR